MTEYEVLSLVLGVLGVVLIPLLVVAFRGMIKWTRVEAKLDHVADAIAAIVRDKDAVHKELSDAMREDRKATNERLRWLEMHAWGKN